MKLKHIQETCCDECGNAIHYHFNCPVCQILGAEITVYGNIWEEITKIGDEFECEECKSIFKLMNQNDSVDCWQWEWDVKPKSSIYAKMLEYSNLAENWDSYGGVPMLKKMFDIVNIYSKYFLLNDVMEPKVVPVSNGGVQFEWDTNTKSLELEFTPKKEILVLYDDTELGIQEDYDFTNTPWKITELVNNFKII